MEKDYKKLLDLHHEFNRFLTQLHGFYLDSIGGFEFLVKYIEGEQDIYKTLVEQGDQRLFFELLDSTSFSHSLIFGKEYAASSVHFTKKGGVKRRNSKGGMNDQFLGRMCISFLYSYWETYFRKELADALGVKLKELLFPIWGDIRILRNCILHKNRLDNEDIKKIRVLNWFGEGDEVIIDQEKLRKTVIAMLAFSNWVHEQSLPKHYIRIPIKR